MTDDLDRRRRVATPEGEDRLDASVVLTRRIDHYQEEIEGDARQRRSSWLQANEGGVTYIRIAEACAVSEPFVAAEIKRAKAEREELALDTG